MRYDRANGPFLPDFELLDVGPNALPIEIYGHRSEAYRTKMIRKEASYLASHGPGGWWSWDVFSDHEPPSFPPRW